ncbi:MAG: response regulator [Candidatus Natronoplasma sp.]
MDIKRQDDEFIEEESTEEEEKVYDILIVDDELGMLDFLKETLKSAKRFRCDVTTATDGKRALEKVKENDYDLVLSDYKMPLMDGVELLKEVKDEKPNALRIMLTGHGDLNVAKQAINQADIHQYLDKPIDKEELRFTVYEELKRKKERDEEDVTDVSGVQEALETVEAFQSNISQERGDTLNKERLVFEFNSGPEFNKFSFELRKKKNVHIEDVHVFENKYIINVGVYPKSYEKIQ